MVSKPPLTLEELDTREAELTARLARIEELEKPKPSVGKKPPRNAKKREAISCSAFSPSLWNDVLHGQRTISAPSTRRLSSL